MPICSQLAVIVFLFPEFLETDRFQYILPDVLTHTQYIDADLLLFPKKILSYLVKRVNNIGYKFEFTFQTEETDLNLSCYRIDNDLNLYF